MQAGFLDTQGRKVWRLAPYILPTLALLFSIFGPIEGVAATMTGFAAWCGINVLGLLDLRQRKLRNVEVECGPGYVDIKKAGTRNQRISAKDVTGATTARTSRGLLLTLQHRRRDEPMTLELANEADAEKVRHALGIGHGGYGVIRWRTESDSTQRGAFVGRILGAASTLLTIILTLAVSVEAGLIAGAFLGIFGFVGAILALTGALSRSGEPSIVMAANGIRLRTPRGWFALPYEALREIDDRQGSFTFRVPEPFNTVFVEKSLGLLGGPSEEARRVIVAQLTAAAQRARGMGPQKNDVTGRVDVLRRNGETPRDWLVRLDMAGQMLATGSGYRGNTLDTEDLWAILEDPEAEADLRAAAARVLRHAPNTGARIDAALAAVRDEPTNRRLRIAIRDDLDGASQALAFLDAEERLASERSAFAARSHMHGS